MKTGIELIAEERARQISQEGWTTEHDDQYKHGELAAAGAVYADASISLMHGVAPAELKEQILHFGCETPWPWDPAWLKLDTSMRALVKAGALIAAQIDQLQRAERPRAGSPEKELLKLIDAAEFSSPCWEGPKKLWELCEELTLPAARSFEGLASDLEAMLRKNSLELVCSVAGEIETLRNAYPIALLLGRLTVGVPDRVQSKRKRTATERRFVIREPKE